MKQFMSHVRSNPASRGFESREPHQNAKGHPKVALYIWWGGGIEPVWDPFIRPCFIYRKYPFEPLDSSCYGPILAPKF